MTAETIGRLPALQALRPLGRPYLERLSHHSSLEVWHVDVAFDEFSIPLEYAERWEDRKLNTEETWQKRPLAAGVDSGCIYSCGEVEIAARLRAAGFDAYWISEWSGFPHVPAWRQYCIKRSEFRARAPELWEYEQALRTAPEAAHLHLGSAGGHPDIAAITPEGNIYLEYKGPSDSIKPKQNGWAAAVAAREWPRLAFLAVRGTFRLSGTPQIVSPPEAVSAVARHGTEPSPSIRKTSPPARGQKQVKPRVRKEEVHRRTISDNLKRVHGWGSTSRLDGSVLVSLPKSAVSIDAFVDEVRSVVEGMGYTPTVRVSGGRGSPVVVVHTPETLRQANEQRGAHGA